MALGETPEGSVAPSAGGGGHPGHARKRGLLETSGPSLFTLDGRSCFLQNQLENVRQLFVPLVRHAHSATGLVKTWDVCFFCTELLRQLETMAETQKGTRGARWRPSGISALLNRKFLIR